MLKLLDRLVPRRIMVRPSVQVLRGRLAARRRMSSPNVGPGMPIVGEFTFGDEADWRAQLLAAVAALSKEAQTATDRLVWLMCIGGPPEAPDDLYALSIQAAPLVQTHMFCNAAEYENFARRYVPLASLREAQARVLPRAIDVLTRPQAFSDALNRASSARASAHQFVKQLGGDAVILAVHAQVYNTVSSVVQGRRVDGRPIKLLVFDLPPDLPQNGEQAPLMTRRMGFTLLEELAIVRFCDGYIGPPNHYAIMAIDAEVRCLLNSEGVAGFVKNDIAAFSSSLPDDVMPWLTSKNAS